jgi:predicted PurR-regulated permease PerM
VFVGADYPFLDVLWTFIVIFAWIIWFWILIRVLADVFRRRDIGGGTKTVWIVFLIFLPFIGVFAYLIANGQHMANRDAEAAQQAQTQFDSYVKTVAGTASGPASEIERAKQLLDNGTITQAEFDSIKAKALASST